jgi:hypothetical protein
VLTPAAEVGPALVLTLRGPLGTDLASLADTVRDGLPTGVTLEDRQRRRRGPPSLSLTYAVSPCSASHSW